MRERGERGEMGGGKRQGGWHDGAGGEQETQEAEEREWSDECGCGVIRKKR